MSATSTSSQSEELNGKITSSVSCFNLYIDKSWIKSICRLNRYNVSISRSSLSSYLTVTCVFPCYLIVTCLPVLSHHHMCLPYVISKPHVSPCVISLSHMSPFVTSKSHVSSCVISPSRVSLCYLTITSSSVISLSCLSMLSHQSHVSRSIISPVTCVSLLSHRTCVNVVSPSHVSTSIHVLTFTCLPLQIHIHARICSRRYLLKHGYALKMHRSWYTVFTLQIQAAKKICS